MSRSRSNFRSRCLYFASSSNTHKSFSRESSNIRYCRRNSSHRNRSNSSKGSHRSKRRWVKSRSHKRAPGRPVHLRPPRNRRYRLPP